MTHANAHVYWCFLPVLCSDSGVLASSPAYSLVRVLVSAIFFKAKKEKLQQIVHLFAIKHAAPLAEIPSRNSCLSASLFTEDSRLHVEMSLMRVNEDKELKDDKMLYKAEGNCRGW